MAFSKVYSSKLEAKALAPKDLAAKYTALQPDCTAAFKHSKSPAGESSSIIIFFLSWLVS